MNRDDVTEAFVEVFIARPFYVASLTGWALWTTAHFLADHFLDDHFLDAPRRFLP